MIFTPVRIGGAWIIEPQARSDDRGMFARTWCAEEFAQHGLDPRLAQSSVSFNRKKGTLRGLHWQETPHGESKLVRCTAGSVFDVLVDLRKESSTYLEWFGTELNSENRAALYVPEGCAHGFLTLSDQTEILYQISTPYVPGFERGLRWDDPAVGIDWPAAVEVISERDRAFPDLAVVA